MKLSTTDITNLQIILNTCALAGIETLVIDDGTFYATNEAKTAAIISTHNVPKLPQKIGLARLSSLRQRLDLFGVDANIEAKESSRGEISMLDISAGRNKVQFRCTASMLIKYAKVINDESVLKVSIAKDEMKMILNAIKIMGGKKLQLTIKKNGSVQVNLSDSTNDVFTIDIEQPATKLTDEEMDSVVHYYTADIFSAVMRSKAEELDVIEFDVGAVGTISSSVNGHSITLLPQINEDVED